MGIITLFAKKNKFDLTTEAQRAQRPVCARLGLCASVPLWLHSFFVLYRQSTEK
jgi:hypothetical protein